jgi:hypothetical protein
MAEIVVPLTHLEKEISIATLEMTITPQETPWCLESDQSHYNKT